MLLPFQSCIRRTVTEITTAVFRFRPLAGFAPVERGGLRRLTYVNPLGRGYARIETPEGPNIESHQPKFYRLSVVH
jgi:hypothetical protein